MDMHLLMAVNILKKAYRVLTVDSPNDPIIEEIDKKLPILERALQGNIHASANITFPDLKQSS